VATSPEKLKRPPVAWERQHKQAAKELITAEMKTLTGMRRAAARALGTLLASLSDSEEPARARSTAINAVRRAVTELSLSLAQEVLDGRQRAREAALRRLTAELTLLRTQLQSAGYRDPVDDPSASDGDEDAALAQSAAASLAAQWSQLAIARVLLWADDPSGSLPAQLKQSLTPMDSRVGRTAATEVSRAYNDEHDEGVGWVAEDNKQAEWLPAVFKYWSAILDRRVCATCAAHDGEIVVVGMKFDGGDEPGSVHVCCRCVDSIVFLPFMLPGKAGEGTYTGLDDDEAA
jgi:hypothetical protein